MRPLITGIVACGGHLFHLGMVEGPDHDSVHVPAQDLGRVGDGFTPPHLGSGRGKKEGVATQLGHSHLEGNPGPGGTLPEDHGQALPGQGCATHLPGL